MCPCIRSPRRRSAGRASHRPKDKEAAEAALKGQGLGLAKAVRKSLEAKTDEL